MTHSYTVLFRIIKKNVNVSPELTVNPDASGNMLTRPPHPCPRLSDAPPQENLPPGIALPAGVALPTGARELDDAGRRNSVGKAKGKAKKPEGCPSTDSDLEVSAWLAAPDSKLRSLQEGLPSGLYTC